MAVSTRSTKVAEDIERRIRSDEFAPHERLPSLTVLSEEYSAAGSTITSALKMLARKGLVTSVRSYGTVVRDWRRPRQVRRRRAVYRDERGYYFDHLAQNWDATGPARIGWEPADDYVADLLGIESGSEVLIRERIVGEEIELAPGRRHINPQQVSKTVVPADIARPLDLGRTDTGPGGVLWRIEDEYGLFASFEDVTYTRLPTKDEAAHLQLGAGDTPVLITAVVMSDSTGRALVVNNYVMDGRKWMSGHPLKRTSSTR